MKSRPEPDLTANQWADVDDFIDKMMHKLIIVDHPVNSPKHQAEREEIERLQKFNRREDLNQKQE